ncbi:hypothetical protein [Microseira wollei]|uniref:hypothetical protein n=1 Tax=Microseira wollei TaxID=467598 RepID=UPI001CFDEB84|nr:hypothetical protein [Microseira wollei]
MFKPDLADAPFLRYPRLPSCFGLARLTIALMFKLSRTTASAVLTILLAACQL